MHRRIRLLQPTHEQIIAARGTHARFHITASSGGVTEKRRANYARNLLLWTLCFALGQPSRADKASRNGPARERKN